MILTFFPAMLVRYWIVVILYLLLSLIGIAWQGLILVHNRKQVLPWIVGFCYLSLAAILGYAVWGRFIISSRQ